MNQASALILVNDGNGMFSADVTGMVRGVVGSINVEALHMASGLIEANDMEINGIMHSRAWTRIMLGPTGWTYKPSRYVPILMREDRDYATRSASDKFMKLVAIVCSELDSSQEFADATIAVAKNNASQQIPTIREELEEIHRELDKLKGDLKLAQDILAIHTPLSPGELRLVASLMDAGHELGDAVAAAGRLL